MDAKAHCKHGDDQARGRVDGLQHYNTRSVSVTVGTIHPQRFWEGFLEGQDEREKTDSRTGTQRSGGRKKKTVIAHGQVSLKATVTFQSAGVGEWVHAQTQVSSTEWAG